MSTGTSLKLPPCGLYRTTRALPGEADVTEGLLVNFHNHSEQNMPVVLLPIGNVFNRWQWSSDPHHVRQLSWIDSLERLPAEGYYSLRRDLVFNEKKSTWPRGSLVQVGYDRNGGPILFIAQLRHGISENTLWFAEQGVAIVPEKLADLIDPLIVYEEPDPATAGAET